MRTGARQIVSATIVSAAAWLCLPGGGARAQGPADVSDYYEIENIPGPPGVDAQVGGLAFLPDGRLAVCFHEGEIGIRDPENGEWTIFADGLHEPLGVVALSDRELLVMQRPELTRIIDTDGDGVADEFETVTDAFGMTGNYHEFAFGPVVDSNGDYFISLNVASNGDTIRREIRGRWMEIGMARDKFYAEDWEAHKKGAGRMYSRVPYRGWVLKVDRETGEITPWACGFRSPNGLGFDAEGRLFVCDNQGDWIGTSKLHHVEKDRFYGHVASLVWREGWKRNPLEMKVEELDALRTRAAVLFPQGIMANSPTQPVVVPAGGKFGPFEGQLLVGEMNQPRIMRLMLEEVSGKLQGACVPMVDKGNLNMGNNRLAFDAEGALWVGQEHLAWAGGKGIQKITWKGEVPLDVHRVNLTKTGFDLTFTRPLQVEIAGDPSSYAVTSYYYEYHAAYGSDQMDKTKASVRAVSMSEDGKKVSLDLGEMKSGYVYEFNLNTLRDAAGVPVLNPLICYTVNRLLDGSEPAAQSGEGGKQNGK